MNDAEIQEIKEDICNNKCRYPEMYLSEYSDPDDAQEAMVNEECEFCPLGNLRS